MELDVEGIRRKIREGRGGVAELLKGLPGVEGYTQYRERYGADRIIRMVLAEALILIKGDVDEAIKRLAEKGELRILPHLNSVNTALEKNVKACQSADFGASSSFSSGQPRFTREDQDEMSDYDARLGVKVEEIKTSIQRLSSADPVERVMIDEVLGKIKEFERAFAERETILMGV